jgi:lysylphosphatidylglycerol synthetase-like protein (DUF2156 family)
MKIKTFIGLLLLLIIGLTSTHCGAAKVGENPSSVAEAEEILAKKAKKQSKIAKKEKKKCTLKKRKADVIAYQFFTTLRFQ